MMTRVQHQEALTRKAKELKTMGDNAPVIERWFGSKENPDWTAWVLYWRTVGAYATLSLIEDRQSWTVPTRSPREFDVDYHG